MHWPKVPSPSSRRWDETEFPFPSAPVAPAARAVGSGWMSDGSGQVAARIAIPVAVQHTVPPPLPHESTGRSTVGAGDEKFAWPAPGMCLHGVAFLSVLSLSLCLSVCPFSFPPPNAPSFVYTHIHIVL